MINAIKYAKIARILPVFVLFIRRDERYSLAIPGGIRDDIVRIAFGKKLIG